MPINPDSLLDEQPFHFLTIPFFTIRSSGFHTTFYWHQLLGLLDAWTSSTLFWMPRVRAQWAPIKFVLAVAIPTNPRTAFSLQDTALHHRAV
jgi:hypothetical protein